MVFYLPSQMRTQSYKGVTIYCYYDTAGMTGWAFKYKGHLYGNSGPEGLLQYAEWAIDALKGGKNPAAWVRWIQAKKKGKTYGTPGKRD